ncbi:MAG: hypothetical protein ACRDRJ_41615, partial [Streptosporangiaceae bacterium]
RRLLDPQMDSGWTPEVNGRPVDWRELADDKFITGPRAWQAARAGTSDPHRHGHPDAALPILRGRPVIADRASATWPRSTRPRCCSGTAGACWQLPGG